MIDYSKLSETAMMDYINETQDVLQNMLDNRVEYFKPFSDLFEKEEIKLIYCTGSGTSFHCAESTRAFMSDVLGVPVLADYPRLIDNFVKTFDQKTMLIAVSQSGESKSSIDTLKFMKSNGAVNVGISEKVEGTSIAEFSDLVLSLHCGEELAGPKTKGYEASMMVLILSALETAHNLGRISDESYNEYISRLQKTIDNISRVIENSIAWYERVEEELLEAKRFILVGYENAYGDVLEGRLKLEESIRFGVEGYELEEFMHGIYHSIDNDVQLFYIAQDSKYKERILNLKNFLKDYSSHGFAIGKLSDSESNSNKDLNMEFVDDHYFCALEYIIPFQIVSYRLSKKKGINANIPKIPNFHKLMGSK